MNWLVKWDALPVVSFVTWAVIIAAVVALLAMCGQPEGWL
jgi:hypothetical protein